MSYFGRLIVQQVLAALSAAATFRNKFLSLAHFHAHVIVLYASVCGFVQASAA